ncbi:MAG: DUF692 domain-containing protein [Myxococcales bacterium]|nr:DUF692 domain-containing protein [Myxococcales bacterium]
MAAPRNERLNGIGLGLRYPLANDLFDAPPDGLKFLEIHPENYLERGGRYANILEHALARWPLLTHGLTLGLGNSQRFDPRYTAQLRQFLARDIRAPWHSEHLCFTEANGRILHELLPLPFTEDAILTAVARVRELRDAVECPIAIENVSYYANLSPPTMSEVEFLLQVVDRADALILLDVNNVYVNSVNHGFDPYAYIDRIPKHRVAQLHVAGHLTQKNGPIIDTHAEPIIEPVYALLDYALRRLGPKPVLLERDEKFPAFSLLVQEIHRLQDIYATVFKVEASVITKSL